MNKIVVKKRFKLYIGIAIIILFIADILLRNTALSNHWLFQMLDTLIVNNAFLIILIAALFIAMFLIETKMAQDNAKQPKESEDEQDG